MIGRLELVTPHRARALAVPLSFLHRLSFADDPWDPQAIGEITALIGFFAAIAWQQVEPVGFAFAFGTGDTWELAALGVLPARRRAGIGRDLLDAVRAEVSRRGGRFLVLEVAADNIAARSLYAACGFVRVGQRRDYYRRRGRAVDADVLRLTLAPPTPSI